MSKAIHVNDETFEEQVLKAPGPVLVDFWAEWCGPCKMIAPILDEIATSMAGRVTVAKVDVDNSRDTPTKYGVRGIPTLMLFKDGEVLATKVGAQSRAALVGWIEGLL